MKKILVPCDFSEQAIGAFRVALDIAAASGGQVHLLNVIELPVMHDTILVPALSYEEELSKELKSKAEKEFEKLKKKYAKEGQKIKVNVHFGATSVMILHYIDETGIDLVVMGSKGVSGIREVLIGSNAEKIVRKSPVPVLVIKKYVKASSIKNIVFPNTLEQDQEHLTMKMKAMQHFFGATLHIVFVNTPSNFIRDVVTRKKLKDFAKRFMLSNYTINIYSDTYEESGIINFAQSVNADMIAMGTHGRRGLNHVLGGSVAEDVVNHVDCPIWTCTIVK